MKQPVYTEPVSVTGGQICGTKTADGKVSIYLGVPYGAAPKDELRFCKAQPVKPWEGVRVCDCFGPAPVQRPQKPFFFWTKEFIIRDTGYDEDCLTMNIWTSGSESKNRPVLVYFHGGGYDTGGSSCEIYDGEQMARRGVVFVNFNHRVGVPSLYTSPELDREFPDGHSGNLMLRDSVFLLQWVQENISSFGGNPHNVTLMGQSSGAGEINALTVSDMAKGLFHRAIVMSQNNLKPAGRPEEWRSLSEEQAMWQDIFPAKSMAEMRRLLTQDMIIRFPKPARPYIDGTVLDTGYREGLTRGRTASLDIMIGAVAGDIQIVNTCYGIFAGAAADMSYEQMTGKLQEFFGEYYEEAAVLYRLNPENIAETVRIIDTDLLICGLLAVAALRRQNGGGRTYVYYYDHLMPGSEQFGVFHTCEVPYMLENLTHDRDDLWKEEDRTFARQLADRVASFVSSGVPGPEWESSSGADYEYLSSEECLQRKMPKEKYDFWMKVFGV